jgi:hypothetical protein
MAGQNIAMISEGVFRDVSLVIEILIDTWNVEYKLATMSKLMLDK